jgi:ABC-type sugar transport system permease subunit
MTLSERFSNITDKSRLFFRKSKFVLGDFFYDRHRDITLFFNKLFHKKEFSFSDADIQKEKRRQKFNYYFFIWGCLAIPIVNFIVFYIYANIDAVTMAFRHNIVDENGATTIVYDWTNFQMIINQFSNPDPKAPIWASISNTLIYWAFSFFIILPLCYLIAYFIYKKIWGYKIFRYIFFLPSILPVVVVTAFFRYMMEPYGPVSAIATVLSGGSWDTQVQLLGQSKTALLVLLLFNMWGAFGVNLIYFTANLERIPQEIVESARLDGAGTWQEIRYILFPLTWSFFSTFMFLSICGIFGSGGATYLFGLNGAYGTWDFPFWQYYMIAIATNDSANTYMCAALGWFVTLIAAPLSLVFRKLANKVEAVEY